MTNNELEQLLKTVKIPERENSFWENFSQTVLRKIGSESRLQAASGENRPKTELQTRRPKLNFALWGIGLATACLVVGFWFGFRNGHSHGTEEQLAAARKYLQNVEALFPNQVRAIVFENGEARLLLSEKADVPSSPPLFVKICSGENCRNIVTFSGQKIQANGQTFEVLSDHRGQILLVGNNSVWSSADPVQKNNRLIQAQPLQL
ncbi:MAG: hypothetical protein ABI042_09235 [Verrucomicrobiota bacterium]